ncbi:unnamed protein product [Alopecurus aequalis]
MEQNERPINRRHDRSRKAQTCEGIADALLLLTRKTVDCLILKQCELEKNTCCPSCWKLRFDLVCSILSKCPAATSANIPIVDTSRPPPHFTTPPLGLIDLVGSSSVPPSSGAPLLLSPLVGRRSALPRSTLHGQVLLQLFAAYSDFPFTGTLTIFDGRSSNYIYRRQELGWSPVADFNSRKKEWLTTHADSSEFKNKLWLNGPCRAISAFVGFSISAYIPETKEEYTVAYDSPDWDDFGRHDEPNTITITTNLGSLYVTCAVLSDAVEADLKVMVRLPWEYPFADVHGHVTAYIGTFEIGTTIFSREADEPEGCPFTDSPEGTRIGTEFFLPLEQLPLVVPTGSCLHIKGELVLDGCETISINHSVPTESDFFETGWAEDNDFEIKTAVCLTLCSMWI